MKAVLFVSNGNGEIAIADRIAQELRDIAPALHLDHLALVGASRSTYLHDVGPQRAMPSGGLIAMGNVGNIARDVRAGLLGLSLAQRRFLKQARGQYDCVVAVGDIFALLMSLAVRVPVTYVGTAKSVRVAAYGRVERAILRRASRVFVRDEETAARLRAQGVDAAAPGNVIVDLFASDDDARAGGAIDGFDDAIALFPGSREAAYDDAVFLVEVVRRVAVRRPHMGAVLSIAPLLDIARFESAFARDWDVVEGANRAIPFELRIAGRVMVRAWREGIGPLLRRVHLVAGQAGTANEAAAAAGIPVVAFRRSPDATSWYRMRQRRLLGEALAVFPGQLDSAAAALTELIEDPVRCARMGAAGRALMGPAGGARAIARAIAGAA